MAKHFLLLFCTLFVIKSDAFSQDNFPALKLRHIQGIKAFDVHGGKSDYGYFGSVGYTYYYSDKFFISVLGNMEKGVIGLTRFENYNFQVNNQHTLFKIKDSFFFNIKYGVQGGVERCLPFENVEEQINYTAGLNGGLQLELFLSNKVALLGIAEQQYNYNSKLGPFHYRYGLGLRFTLN